VGRWTQPVCADCWAKDYPQREPFRVLSTKAEICCKCGTPTGSGILFRVDPSTVPYPSGAK